MNPTPALRIAESSPYRALIGVGGIGSGIFFALEGNDTLGRNESRPGRLRDVRDYCKLHIITHYVAVLLDADPSGAPFHVLPVGRVGCDGTGRRVRSEMQNAGMDVRFVAECPGLPTTFSVCFQYPDGSGGNITTSESAASSLDAADLERAFDFAASRGTRWIALAAPEVPLPVRGQFLRSSGSLGAFRAAAFATAEVRAALDGGLFEMLELVALNQDEAAMLAGGVWDPADPLPFLSRCESRLRGLNPGIRIAVTAGPRGAWFLDGDAWEHCPAPVVPVASTAGAGDALLGGLLAGMAAGLPFVSGQRRRGSFAEYPVSSALDLSVLLASYTVTSPHTIHPDADWSHLKEFADSIGARIDPSV